MKRIVLALALVTITHAAHADTVHLGKAELDLPAGWTSTPENGHLLLANRGAMAIIEVYEFSKVPDADKAALTKLVDDRPETDDVAITSVETRRQHGLTGIAFAGTAKIRGRGVAVSSVALALPSRAVVAVAFASNPDAAHAREIAEILASARASR